MGTRDLIRASSSAETPLVRALETIARALAGLTDLALVQYWASEGAEPTIEQIPDLVLPLGPEGRARSSAVPCRLIEADLDHRCGDCGRRLLNLIYGRRVARALGPILRSWPRPTHWLLGGLPIIRLTFCQRSGATTSS
jgi:hypothetical protein